MNPLFSLFRGAGQDRYQANRSQLGSTVNNGIPANNVQGTANDPSLQAANAGAQSQPYAAYQAANPTAKPGCWNEFLDRWFGTGYRTSSFRVPVTYFRPVIRTDPTTGQQVVVQQPCTSFVEQQQRSPIRFFRSARPSQSIPVHRFCLVPILDESLSAWLRRCDAERHLPRSWLCSIGQSRDCHAAGGICYDAQRTAVCPLACGYDDVEWTAGSRSAVMAATAAL